MIYINNKFIDLLVTKDYNGDDPLLNFIKSKLLEIKAFPQKVVFKYRKGVIRRNKLQGLKEYKKTHIRMISNIRTPRGSEQWVCTTSVAKDPVTGYIKPNPKHEPFNGTWILDKFSEVDKILFLLCAVSQTRGANPLIVRENLELEAKTSFNVGMDSARFKLLLADLGMDQLTQLGLACAIANPAGYSPDVLRNLVFNKAEFDVKKRVKSYDDYIKMATDKRNSRILSMIQESIDRLIISYSERNKAYWWLMANEQLDEELLPVAPGHYDQKESLLAEFLRQNNAQFIRLEKTLSAVKSGNNILKNKSDELGTGVVIKDDSIDEPNVSDGPDGGAGGVPAFLTPDGEMTIEQIRVYADENEVLPFAITDKKVMNEIARAIGIQLATPQRKREVVYEELKMFFEIKPN